jgi:hypothetical protein
VNQSIKLVSSICVALLLTACGGGGSGTSMTAENPLKKYAGTFYACDRNQKVTMELSEPSLQGLNMTLRSEVFSAENCSGNVIATYAFNSAAHLNYEGTTTANLPPFTLFPASDVIDKIALVGGTVTASLTGTGVKGSCVDYAYTSNGMTSAGNICYDLNIGAANTKGALYLSSNGQNLIQFELLNGLYEYQGVMSRNSSFNLTTLVRDSVPLPSKQTWSDVPPAITPS